MDRNLEDWINAGPSETPAALKHMAATFRNYHQALVAEGFSDEQAVTILAALVGKQSD